MTRQRRRKKSRRSDITRGLLRRFNLYAVQIENPRQPHHGVQRSNSRMLFSEIRLFEESRSFMQQLPQARWLWGSTVSPLRPGIGASGGGRNAPDGVTTPPASSRNLWAGRMETVEQQALGPILNPIEMALPSAGAWRAGVEIIPEYRAAFKSAFPARTTQ